jgi:hypothetical protein
MNKASCVAPGRSAEALREGEPPDVAVVCRLVSEGEGKDISSLIDELLTHWLSQHG